MTFTKHGTQPERAGGRSARVAARLAQSAPHPCPPGQKGGHYAPLTDAQVERILTASYAILETIGMGEAPPILVDKAVQAGAKHGDDGRLRFPRALVEDLIAVACDRFTYYGRDPKHHFAPGRDRVFFGTGGAAVLTLDCGAKHYRPSTLNDLYAFARLVDGLDNLSWFTRNCVATDVADLLELDLNTAYALIAGTTKPVGMSFTDAKSVDAVVALFDCALGGEGRFCKQPFCKAHVSPIISPLRYGSDALEVTLACMKHNMPINAVIAAQSGATAPASLAGMLATTTAETLAALIFINLFSPGYPMVFSNWPLVIDLRSGSFSGGGGEISLLNAASAQISNRLGVVSGVGACMSDAKSIDAQIGMEKSLSALSTGLAGANLVYEAAGMSASLLGTSFEAFVLDHDMLGHCQRILRGIEVNDETLDLDNIQNSVFGDGHFLGAAQTLRLMQSEYYYPELGDRDAPVVWHASGSPDIRQKAQQRVLELLKELQRPYLDDKTDRMIRNRFNIRLDLKQAAQNFRS